jgi:regulator of replication initiation timing
MNDHIKLLRQRLQELRDQVRVLNEDRQLLQLQNANLRAENRELRAAQLQSPSLGDDPYWAAAANAGKLGEWA